jgi:predicted DNA-binding protein with PD1-like motif
MKTLPIRMSPGEDVRKALEAAVAARGGTAAFVLSGIGSLSTASIRFAGRAQAETRTGDLEILTLAGTVAGPESHVHASLADADGVVFGGHLGYGSIVRTTCEILLALLGEWDFSREHDTDTGYRELAIRPRDGA